MTIQDKAISSTLTAERANFAALVAAAVADGRTRIIGETVVADADIDIPTGVGFEFVNGGNIYINSGITVVNMPMPANHPDWDIITGPGTVVFQDGTSSGNRFHVSNTGKVQYLAAGAARTAMGAAASGHDHDDRYYTEGESDGKYSLLGHTHDDRYFTETESDARFAAIGHNHNASYSPLGHTHDDRYFTESEADARFAAISHNHDSSYYTKTQSDGRYYTKSESDGRFAALSHNHDDRYFTETELSNSSTALSLSNLYTPRCFVGSNFLDLINDSPWYGIGKSDVTFGGEAGQAVQTAGYFGLIFKTAAHEMRILGNAAGAPTYDGNNMWHAGNDGAGSGLDADTLDGSHASAFSLSGHTHDDRYFTETESDARFAALLHNHDASYSAIGHTHTTLPPLSITPQDGGVEGGEIGLAGAGSNPAVSIDNYSGDFRIHSGGSVRFKATSSALYQGGNLVWHAGNDGAGSGLDADVLDGQHASAFSLTSHNHDTRYIGITSRKKIVIYGSSTAAGTGASDYAHSWAGLLAAALPDWTIVNKSIGGNKTQDLIDRFYTDCAPEFPDVVVLAIGFYNENLVADPDGSYTTICKNYDILHRMCEAIGARCVVVGPYGKSTATAATMAVGKRLYEHFQSRGFAVLDFQSTTTNPSTGVLWPTLDYGDGTHFNDAGHAELFRSIPLSIFTAIQSPQRKPPTNIALQLSHTYTGLNPLYVSTPSTMRSFSAMAWMRHTIAGHGKTLIWTNDNALRVRTPDPNGDFHLTSNAGDLAISNVNFYDNKWHHLGMSYNAITNTASLYVDGVLIGSGSPGALSGTTTISFLGRTDTNIYNAIDHSIARPAVYRTCLLDEDFKAAYLGHYPTKSQEALLSFGDCSSGAGLIANVACSNAAAKIVDAFTVDTVFTGHTHDGDYAALSHAHDDRYFTESESDARYSQLGHTHALTNLTDVSIATPADRQSLVYNSCSSKWENIKLSASNVGACEGANYQSLVYDDQWINVGSALESAIVPQGLLVAYTTSASSNQVTPAVFLLYYTGGTRYVSKISDPANQWDTADTDGKCCVIAAGSDYRIKNRLGGDATIKFHLVGKW